MKITKDSPLLTHYILGEVTPEEKIAVELAIQNDPEIKKAYEDLKPVINLAKTLQNNSIKNELTPEQRNKILKAIGLKEKSDSSFGWGKLAGSLIAASLALVIYINNNQIDSRTGELKTTVPQTHSYAPAKKRFTPQKNAPDSGASSSAADSSRFSNAAIDSTEKSIIADSEGNNTASIKVGANPAVATQEAAIPEVAAIPVTAEKELPEAMSDEGVAGTGGASAHIVQKQKISESKLRALPQPKTLKAPETAASNLLYQSDEAPASFGGQGDISARSAGIGSGGGTAPSAPAESDSQVKGSLSEPRDDLNTQQIEIIAPVEFQNNQFVLKNFRALVESCMSNSFSRYVKYDEEWLFHIISQNNRILNVSRTTIKSTKQNFESNLKCIELAIQKSPDIILPRTETLQKWRLILKSK